LAKVALFSFIFLASSGAPLFYQKHKSPTEVVMEALREYIQYHKQLQILALFGTIDYDKTYDYKEQRQRQ
jgi:hypothetical protein